MPETGGLEDRAGGGVRLPYMPGLDGLRAFAVIAVLLYHAELPWIRGGFLGVEVFFVISGYLITTLLLAEWHQQGRIDLVGFWLRRARRLLPALYLLLVVTLAFAVVFLPGEVARLRDDALAAFGYVTNWYLILGEQSYFETVGRPSLLQHLWSLAVEEQFYVLWPLLLTFGLWGVPPTMRWRRRRLALFIALAGAIGSALLMAALYQPGVDPSRVYYGTDTRVAGLLFGAALAFVWKPGQTPRWAGRRTRALLLDVAGLAALGALVWFYLRLDQYQPFLFRGGFTLVALATAVAILVAVCPHSHLGPHLLGWRPLRWIGLRSYGIYLWHWPIFMLTRPELDVPITGLPLLALRLAATILLADLSYRFVETPIRTGALGRAWRALREARGARRWRLGAYWSGAVGTGATLFLVLSLALAHAQPPAPPSYLSAESIHTEGSSAADSETAPADDASAGTVKDPITLVGDSVMLGSVGELERTLGNPAFATDVGLQPFGVIEILKKRHAAGQLGEAVVVHAGNNVPFTAEQFDEMMGLLEDVPKVLIVNVKVPRPWEQPNNEVLADGVRRYPDKAVLVDWHTASAGRPELFVEDGIHLQPEGQRVYADLIATRLEAP